MSSQAPDFAAVEREAGPETNSAFQTLWFGLQDAIIEEARSTQVSRDRIEPRVLASAPSANVDNMAIGEASIIHFTGASSVNLTGFVAPSPNKARVLFVYVSGSGTITLKHEATSTATNQLTLITGADTALATKGSAIFIYLASKWKQVL